MIFNIFGLMLEVSYSSHHWYDCIACVTTITLSCACGTKLIGHLLEVHKSFAIHVVYLGNKDQ